MKIKPIYTSILIRFFDSFVKFFLYLIMPFLIGFNNTSEIQLFLSLIFISSVFFRFSSEEIMLKKMSTLNYNHDQFKNFTKHTLSIILVSYTFFLILTQILVTTTLKDESNLVLQIINEHYILIIFNSFVFTIISIISFGLRAIGRINLCIILQGTTWPFILLTLVIFSSSDQYEFDFIVRYFTLFFFFVGLFAAIYFYKHVLSLKENGKSEVKNELKIDRKNSYIQSIAGLFLNWFPLIIFGLFNDSYSTGIFGTYFKIGVGFFYFLLVIDFNAGKILSTNFQLNKKNKIQKSFHYYQKFYIIFSVFTLVGSIIFIYIFNKFFDTSLFDPIFFTFLLIILCSSIFGPVDISLLMLNKEKLRSKCAIYFISSILLIFTPTTIFFNYDYSLYVFGILFFSNYLVKYKFIKKEINNII